jgi:elongator complex protein 2
MSYSSLFIAGAANTVSTGTTWIHFQSTTLVIYALSNCVAVADTKLDRVLCTLRLSQIDDKINVLRTIEDVQSNSIIVLSGSEKGFLNVWKLSTTGNDPTAWTSVYDASEMKGAVSTFSTYITSENLLVCVCDTTGYSKILITNTVFLNPDQQKVTFKLIQSINFHPQQLPNSVHFMSLSFSCLSLVVGSVDAKLHIYTAAIEDLISTSTNSTLFKSSGSLPGHEEWITSLSSIIVNQNTTFLASSSQDCKIRLWKFVTQDKPNTVEVTSTITVTDEEEEEDDTDDGEDEGEEGTEKQVTTVMEEEVTSEARLQFPIDANSKIVYVFLESLLIGHEDWVTTVAWLPKSTDSQGNEVFKLFSTSMDRNMVIWSPDASAGGVWMPIVRVGDIGGALGGSIGGNLLGFVGGCPSPDGLGILGIGYGGSFHYWKQHESENRWYPVPFLSGHFQAVHDIAWEVSQGQYLISVSSDQTCRLFAPLKAQQSVWKEISRPEIHGYDLNCVALSKTSNIILTAGEEKIIRGFDVPGAVLRGLKELAGIELPYPSTVRYETFLHFILFQLFCMLL